MVWLVTGIAVSVPASAQTSEQEQIQALRNQLRQMQQQLQQLEHQQLARDAQTEPNRVTTSSSTALGVDRVEDLCLQSW